VPHRHTYAAVRKRSYGGQCAWELRCKRHEFDVWTRTKIVGAITFDKVRYTVDRLLENIRVMNPVLRGVEERAFAMCAERL